MYFYCKVHHYSFLLQSFRIVSLRKFNQSATKQKLCTARNEYRHV